MKQLLAIPFLFPIVLLIIMAAAAYWFIRTITHGQTKHRKYQKIKTNNIDLCNEWS